MSLRDDIFPPGPPRDGNIIRTEWVGTWESQFLGLGRLTSLLTDRLLSESFAADDMALYVIFLQRHRVEVGLKLVIERCGTSIPITHKPVPLLGQVRTALTNAGFAAVWPPFERAVGEYIRLVDEIDEGAATFRYPVDRNEQEWARDDFVDLVQLEKAGASFQSAVLEVIERLADLEPLPISTLEAAIVAGELRDLSIACRRMMAVNDSIFDQLRANFARLRGQPGGAAEAQMRAALEVRQSAEDLATRADRMRGRVERAFSVSLPPLATERPLPAIPPFNIVFQQAAMDAQIAAFAKAVANATLDWLKPLQEAVDAMSARSAHWSTPYARQLRDEVGRLRSRQSRLS